MATSTLINLSPRARMILADITSSGVPGREVRRAQALLWLDAGESVQAVANRLQVSRQMLYGLVARYSERQDLPVRARIQDEVHSGRPAAKRAVAMEAIKALLAKSPAEYGYREQLWTTPLLKAQIKAQQGVVLSDDTIQRALHDLHYRYKRPRYVLARRDPFWRQAKGGSKTA
jgi:transposase